VHPVYIIATVGLFVGATRILVAESDAWLRVGRPILDAFL
jgi:hypothetical protein